MPRKSNGTRKRSPNYSRTKGHQYETKIAQELRNLGYTGVKTSRECSKLMDNNKVDLVDTENKLPFWCQLKKTQNIPSYFRIKSECPLTDKPFVIFWAAQVRKTTNICTQGEVVILPKEYFYELITQKEQE